VTPRSRLLSVVAWLACAAGSAVAAESPDFATAVRPLLVAKCGTCHGAAVRRADLDLSSLAGIAAGGESGEPLVGDSLETSALWHAVATGVMPPEGEPALDAAEIDLLRRWISSGPPLAEAGLAAGRPLGVHDLLPIVLLRCVACHGSQRQDGGLDLGSREAMLHGGTSGPALVPGDPAGSRMIARIESGACPPGDRLLRFFVKRPAAAEVARLRAWIAAGAPEGDTVPDVAGTGPDPLVTDDDRRHWAFVPPRRPAPGSSIDDFIAARLAAAGLEFAPEADRDTLIRRVHLDLLGLPPSLAEWRRWHDDPGADWYERMVDALLASPHHGERQARHWLDLAGYADSEGGVSGDPLRSVAWKYRDYCVAAFNDDLPYDRFLLEQLAGDELVDHERAPEITDEIVRCLVATGFLRMGVDETGSRTMNFVPERLEVIDDAIAVVGGGLMGLTLECARCHSHKYDPIPQRDYFRFKAIFQGALDEHDWLTFRTRRLEVGTPAHRARIAAENPPLEAEIGRLTARLESLRRDWRLALLRHHHPAQPAADNEATLAALGVADNSRTLVQRTLVERLQEAEALPEEAQPEALRAARRAIDDTQREIWLTRRRLVPPLEIRALWDAGRPSPTYVLRRGEHDQPGRLVGPGVPAVLTDGRTPFESEPPFPDGTPRTGRRLALARWLTRPDHPLTARVLVNRVWHQHFGAGLVRTLDDFGVQGEPPTHPELLDWLAVEFVERGWSMKALHRLILTSRTYRQSSRVTAAHTERDPQNRLWSRMAMRRLDAESLRDSLLFVADRLDPTPGGIPDVVTVNRDGLVEVAAGADGRWRRSLYAQQRRTEIPTLLATFDYPPLAPNCLARSVSIVSPQALLLANDAHVHELAGALAARVELLLAERDDGGAAPSTTADRVELVWRVALSRDPLPEERAAAVAALADLERAWGGDAHAALASLCHTVFNSGAFVHVD
jgi:hypothetical protein